MCPEEAKGEVDCIFGVLLIINMSSKMQLVSCEKLGLAATCMYVG